MTTRQKSNLLPCSRMTLSKTASNSQRGVQGTQANAITKRISQHWPQVHRRGEIPRPNKRWPQCFLSPSSSLPLELGVYVLEPGVYLNPSATELSDRSSYAGSTSSPSTNCTPLISTCPATSRLCCCAASSALPSSAATMSPTISAATRQDASSSSMLLSSSWRGSIYSFSSSSPSALFLRRANHGLKRSRLTHCLRRAWWRRRRASRRATQDAYLPCNRLWREKAMTKRVKAPAILRARGRWWCRRGGSCWWAGGGGPSVSFSGASRRPPSSSPGLR
jgi:hypothetical protein